MADEGEGNAGGKIRRICYADAALVNNLGHHANLCRHISGELRRRGIAVDILANASIESSLIDELNALPIFRHYPYVNITHHKAENFFLARASFMVDLIEATTGQPYDLVYLSSILPAQMAAVILWGQSRFSAAGMPPIVFELGLPSGAGDATCGIWGRFTKHYRSAVRTIRESHSGKFLFFTFDPVASRDYADVFGFEVEFLPPVYAGGEVRLRTGDERGWPVVGFLGHQRAEKGYHLVPDVVRLLLERGVPASFLVHNGVPREKATDRELRELAVADPRVRFDQQPADKSYWNDLLDSTDIVALPYEPSRYAASFSAIAAEAVSCGLPIVSPRGTTMKTLAERYQDNALAIADWTSEAIADAICEAVRNFPALAQSAFEGAGRWAAENGASAFASRLLAFGESHAALCPSLPGRRFAPIMRCLTSYARAKIRKKSHRFGPA